ncbi:MAG: ParB/RepB/Spo0J family partition protein [Moraxella sp.]|jgi:ParB family chromosome partitioning protein
MVKKRGLASNRGLDALLGSIKTEKLITGNLAAAHVNSNDQGAAAYQNDAVTAPSKAVAPKKTPTDCIAAASLPTRKKNTDPVTTQPAKMADNASLNLIHIHVDCLQRGKYQPRIDLGEEALQELATSIKQYGVMQPIVIRPLAKPAQKTAVTHEIIAGERRWRAAQIAGLTHIPAIIRPISDDLAIALALIENIQREDLSVMEQAAALQRFHDEFGMSHSQIADVVGKARTTVSNLLRLNQLHDDVKDALNDGLMDMGHARALLGLSPQQQPVISKKIIHHQLTVRQTEQLVKDILNPKQPTQSPEIDYDRLRLNQHLSEQLGAVVKIKGSSKGKGSIEIFFHNEEELQSLISQLQTQIS